MCSKFNCATWFILSVLFVILLSFGWRKYDDWRERRRYEDRIDAFDQETVSPLVLPADKVVIGELLSGRWVTTGRRYGSTLVFEQMKEGNGERYGVEFTTHTCTERLSRVRTAEYRDGKVLLDKPVAEALGPVYQRLYCVRVGGKRALIPEVRSEDTKVLLTALHDAENRNEWRGLQALAYLYENGQRN